MSDRELLQQALAALSSGYENHNALCDAIRAALAQPAPAVQVVLRQPNLFAADPAAPAVPDGMVMMPREPTSNMLAALSGEWHPSRHEGFHAKYRAMLAAAPTSAPAAPAVLEPLTAERLQKHAMFAADAPPASAVVLVSSLHRLLGITGDGK